MTDPTQGRARLRSMLGAVTLVQRAGGGTFLATLILFAVSNLGLVVELMIGNQLLHVLVGHGHDAPLTPSIWVLLISVVVISGIVAFAGAAGAGLHRLLTERTIRYCSAITLAVTARVPLREFESPAFHDRLERVRQNHSSPLEIAIAVPQLVSAAIGAIAVLVGLAVINPLLAPVTLLSAAPIWLVGRSNSDEMYSFSFGNAPYDRARQNLEKIINDRESAAEVRAFRLSGYLTDRWAASYDDRIAEITGLVRRFVRRSAFGAAIASLVLVVVFVIILMLVGHDGMSLAAAAAACVAVLILANRCQQAATSAARLVEQSHYVQEFLDLSAWSASLPVPRVIQVQPFTALQAHAISFSYPAAERLALDQVSLRIERGEVIAIVGPNGSGKTTLAKLLAGLYPPTDGVITWDDRPLSAITQDGGLSEVGVVFQEFGHYWFSAADNIAVGAVQRSGDHDGVRRAADRAGVTQFVNELPRGFDTPLGVEVEGGTDLSGGQWQRIAIARVLFRDASFLIMDEPTAALDAEAEAALFETIAALAEGRTVVLISHRFSTVRSADRILVLDHGRLIEQGSHAELMALGGRYARMYSLQAKAYAPG
ncbi:MAG: ABC transporter ATP-binding protein [Microlunatus sp.]|nr:ABC transporter ATP-binding protein [Microlunatus sp.]